MKTCETCKHMKQPDEFVEPHCSHPQNRLNHAVGVGDIPMSCREANPNGKCLMWEKRGFWVTGGFKWITS